jgi:hypothetical protein
MPRRRAAVVIGVNRTGGLPVLESAAAGASDVEGWLKAEGFDVTAITDALGKVKWEQIAGAVAAIVEAGNCHQLVIYFSGHGFWKNETELWLLNDAPVDANAAVSWAETAELAKDCGTFQAPDPDMIREMIEDGRTIDVVPNRRLGKYLQREVGALLASVPLYRPARLGGW